MRKLTPEERAAKKALAHAHDENCGHLTVASPAAEAPVAVAEEAPVAVEAPVAETPAEEVAEEKPKRKYTKKSAEEATEEAPAEEA